MTKDEELQKYMVMIENYKEQISQLEIQQQYLQAAIAEYTKAKITLDNLSKADDKTDILLPIGGSTYIDATTKNTSKVLFDVGAGIVTEKSYEDAIKKIDERMQSLEQTQEKFSTMMEQIQNEATEISNKAQKLMAEEK
jgi:prefoldin alpha subunit